MNNKLIIFLIFLSVFPAFSADLLKLNPKFVNAIGIVESNNRDSAIGDNGKSISRYQIQRAAYLDAKEFNKSIKFSYESLTNRANALIVMESYLNRYAREAIKKNDFESLARLWNSGPNWKNKKNKTEIYWGKVKKALNTQN